MLAAPVSLALIAFVYGAAFIGQGLSVDQMYALRAFVERVVQEEGRKSPMDKQSVAHRFSQAEAGG